MDRHRTGFGQGCNFRNWLKDKGLRPLMDRMDIRPPAPSLSQWFLRVYPQDLETTGCRTGVSAHEAGGPRNIYPTPHLAICSSHRHREYAHCTGAWRTGTGGYALVPGFINGAPRIRLPLIGGPPASGGGEGDRCPSVQCPLVHCSSVQCRRIHSSVYAHWPVCTVYTLYSVYVQCTVYTLYSVTIVYTVQCIARVYTDQCISLSSVCSGTMTMHTHNVTVYSVSVLFIVLYTDTG